MYFRCCLFLCLVLFSCKNKNDTYKELRDSIIEFNWRKSYESREKINLEYNLYDSIPINIGEVLEQNTMILFMSEAHCDLCVNNEINNLLCCLPENLECILLLSGRNFSLHKMYKKKLEGKIRVFLSEMNLSKLDLYDAPYYIFVSKEGEILGEFIPEKRANKLTYEFYDIVSKL